MAASQFLLLLHAARTVKTCLWLMYRKPGSAGATCSLQLWIQNDSFADHLISETLACPGNNAVRPCALFVLSSTYLRRKWNNRSQEVNELRSRLVLVKSNSRKFSLVHSFQLFKPSCPWGKMPPWTVVAGGRKWRVQRGQRVRDSGSFEKKKIW